MNSESEMKLKVVEIMIQRSFQKSLIREIANSNEIKSLGLLN